MEPCLNPSLTVSRDLKQYLDIAQSTGYSWVEADIGSIRRWVEETGIQKVKEEFAARGLRLASIGLPVNVSGEESSFRDGLSKLKEYAKLALALDCTRCCTWLQPSVDELPVPYASRLARRFRLIADVLAAYGIRLGLEFVGPHHLRNKTYPFVYTIEDTLEYISSIGAPNIGLLVDSYHWYTTQATVDDLKRIPAGQIVFVHVNDSNCSPAEALDHERLLPGEGCIDLPGFFKGLSEAGYHGPVSIEVLRTRPFVQPEAEVALQARRAVEKLLIP
ncbi:sugar phosphate isomerase/epimerase family protein [Lihuaxuella thermophila]|uniref:Sugar phosphate isomerase/epimerase n=1 Tax=Lihuaxuella thermophila TaxID=1173111 RepID=A0A1H8FHJ7_9BACL|nr:sugar phosphate isomerase/epimerase family protein [Lihuaxuella thermophila]SEN31102.1 Sugar phosphate isomerase/epimerase [Lihuaxuella thermophila]